MGKYEIIELDRSYLKDVQAILNKVIETSTALFDLKPRSLEKVVEWYEKKQSMGFPLLGVKDENGVLMGFATYDHFRHLEAYQYSVEHSIYVSESFQGKGLGKVLLQSLMVIAEKNKVRSMIGVIESENIGSISLHKKFGYQYCGELKDVGYKFDRWLDVVFYQYIFEKFSPKR